MAQRRDPENAVQRLQRRILERIHADKHRPLAYRRTQQRLAEKIGISKQTLTELLHTPASTRGLLAHLDKIAEYFGVPPSLLIHRNDTSLMELQQEEYRLLKHWRTFPPDVQMRVMEMFDYFAGLLPEEKEQRRWWMKIRRLDRREREHVERSLDAVLRAKMRDPKTTTDAPTPAAATDTETEARPARGTTPAARRRGTG